MHFHKSKASCQHGLVMLPTIHTKGTPSQTKDHCTDFGLVLSTVYIRRLVEDRVRQKDGEAPEDGGGEEGFRTEDWDINPSGNSPQSRAWTLTPNGLGVLPFPFSLYTTKLIIL